MQLSLLSRTAPGGSEARTGPSTQPGAWRDSAISQLDTLAATHERAALQTFPGRALAAAGLALAVVLGAAVLWPAPGTALPARPGAMPTPGVGTLATAPAALSEAAPAVSAGTGASPDPSGATPVSEETSMPAAAAADDDEARKARALRRKAALLAQERERADEEARRQMQALATQREDAERARQEQAQRQLADAARERAAAAQGWRPVSAAPAAPAGPRGVSELCAGSGGLVSEQACQARACWRAEHRSDPVCVQLREAEALRQQRGTDH